MPISRFVTGRKRLVKSSTLLATSKPEVWRGQRVGECGVCKSGLSLRTLEGAMGPEFRQAWVGSPPDPVVQQFMVSLSKEILKGKGQDVRGVMARRSMR